MRTPNDHEAAVLDALVRVARPIILKRFNPDSCIASTKIALEALTYFGIRGKEMQVFTILLNAEAAALLEGGMDLVELHAHTQQIAPAAAGGPWTVGVGAGQGGAKRWVGHLVATLPTVGALIDLSIDQANRPHKDLTLEPFWSHITEPGWWTTPPTKPLHMEVTTDGTVVVIDRRVRADRGYRTSPDWTGQGSGRAAQQREVVADIIVAMRAHLDQAQA